MKRMMAVLIFVAGVAACSGCKHANDPVIVYMPKVQGADHLIVDNYSNQDVKVNFQSAPEGHVYKLRNISDGPITITIPPEAK